MSEPSCRTLVIRWIDHSLSDEPGGHLGFRATDIHQDLCVWAARAGYRPHSLSTVKTILRRFVRLGALTDEVRNGHTSGHLVSYTLYRANHVDWHRSKWAKGGWR